MVFGIWYLVIGIRYIYIVCFFAGELAPPAAAGHPLLHQVQESPGDSVQGLQQALNHSMHPAGITSTTDLPRSYSFLLRNSTCHHVWSDMSPPRYKQTGLTESQQNQNTHDQTEPILTGLNQLNQTKPLSQTKLENILNSTNSNNS